MHCYEVCSVAFYHVYASDGVWNQSVIAVLVASKLVSGPNDPKFVNANVPSLAKQLMSPHVKISTGHWQAMKV